MVSQTTAVCVLGLKARDSLRPLATLCEVTETAKEAITLSPKAVEKSKRKALLTGLADRFAQQARQLGADPDEALSALRIAFDKR